MEITPEQITTARAKLVRIWKRQLIDMAEIVDVASDTRDDRNTKDIAIGYLSMIHQWIEDIDRLESTDPKVIRQMMREIDDLSDDESIDAFDDLRHRYERIVLCQGTVARILAIDESTDPLGTTI